MDWLGSLVSGIQKYFSGNTSDPNLMASLGSDSEQNVYNRNMQTQAMLHAYKSATSPAKNIPVSNYGAPSPTPTQQLQTSLQQPKQTISPTINPYGGTQTNTIPGVHPQVANNFMDILQNHILPVTRKYGIPDALTAAQMAHESAYAQQPAGANNYFGLKAHSYPGFAHFATPEQGAEYYAQTIQALAPHAAKNNADAHMWLQELQGHGKTGNYEGDNPNPQQYVYDVSQNPLWSQYGQTPLAVNPQGWK